LNGRLARLEALAGEAACPGCGLEHAKDLATVMRRARQGGDSCACRPCCGWLAELAELAVEDREEGRSCQP
jgi:hypothetical protein